MLVAHVITGLNNGGAEAVLYRLLTNEPKLSMCVVVSLTELGTYGPRLEQAGVKVHCLHMPRGRVTIKGLWQIYCLFRKYRPDVVQTWMYHADLLGGIVARLARVPAVVWGIRHSDLDPTKTSWSTRMVARLNALLSNWVPQRIISCSREAMVAHQDLGYNANKFVVIPNGYQLEHFAPSETQRQELREHLGIDPDALVIGMVARNDPQKNHANLLHALLLLKELGYAFSCLLVGTGMGSDNLIIGRLIHALNLYNEVRLLGQRHDIPAIMNTLDIHVLSSYGEAFPNVVAEAMACGTPCVVADVGDAALIVGETGWVVPPRDSQALCTAMVTAVAEMQTQKSLWSLRKERCRQRIVDNFDLAKMVLSYQNIWDEVVKESMAGEH